MKTMQKFVLVIVLSTLTLFAAGQTPVEIDQMLSRPETRKQIMDRIANDTVMSNVMMTTMMSGNNYQVLMVKNHGAMMKMMNANPGMRHEMVSNMMEACKSDTAMRNCMMSNMMEACKSDTAMRASLHKHMMGNPEMQNMTEKRMKESQDSKTVEGLDKTKLVKIKK